MRQQSCSKLTPWCCFIWWTETNVVSPCSAIWFAPHWRWRLHIKREFGGVIPLTIWIYSFLVYNSECLNVPLICLKSQISAPYFQSQKSTHYWEYNWNQNLFRKVIWERNFMIIRNLVRINQKCNIFREESQFVCLLA